MLHWNVYSYLIISTDIGIHAVSLGICVLSWDMWHRIGIHDNASGHDRDAMPSHATWTTQICSPCSVGRCTHTHALLFSLWTTSGRDTAFEKMVTGSWSNYRWLY
jgi:hypothetical protein